MDNYSFLNFLGSQVDQDSAIYTESGLISVAGRAREEDTGLEVIEASFDIAGDNAVYTINGDGEITSQK